MRRKKKAEQAARTGMIEKETDTVASNVYMLLQDSCVRG